MIKQVSRWQESLVWMPICLVLGLGAWIVLGGLDRSAAKDIIPLWTVLPAKIAYAFAALAATHLARRRWRFKLTPEQRQDWWQGVMDFAPGPIVVLVVDAVFSLCALAWLLEFFSLPG